MNESQSGSLREKPGTAAVAPAAKEEIKKHVKELLSDDFKVRAASMTSLEKYGAVAAEAIVDALVKIGKPSLNVIVHALNHIADVKRPEDAYLIENFVEILTTFRDRRAAAT